MLALAPSGLMVFLMVLALAGILGLSLFGAYCCVDLRYSPDPPTTRSLRTLVPCELVSAGLVLLLAVSGSLWPPNLPGIFCTAPFLFFTCALLLWFARRAAKKP